MFLHFLSLAMGHQLQSLKGMQRSWMDGFKTFATFNTGAPAQDTFTRSTDV